MKNNNKNLIKKILGSQRIIAISTLLILVLFFSIFGRYFFTFDTFYNLLESSYYQILLAIGMTFIIASGGIDLSVGTSAMCGAIVGGVAYNVWGLPMEVSLFLIVFTSTMFGALNGFFVAKLNIPPFIATLGTSMIAQGIGYIVSNVRTMRYPIITEPDGWFKRIFYKSLDGFPMGIIYVVILFLIALFLFRYTKLGKYSCAIGSNKEATRLSGVNVFKWEFIIYILGGVFAGFAGIFYSATYTSILPGSGSGMELEAIAATVIGGTSLAGGRATIIGSLIGVFIMSTLKNGLMTIGLQQQWQIFFTGIALILAILMDIYQNKKEYSN